jgi:hypothetical protein
MPNIEGLDDLFRRLDRVSAAKVLVPPMHRAVERIKRRMQEYPPALAPMQGTAFNPVRFTTRGGKAVSFMAKARKPYRRTGTYGRRWTGRVVGIGNGVQGRVGNNVRYAPYVGSARWQARVHRNRWNTDTGVLQDELPAIRRDFAQSVQRALGK